MDEQDKDININLEEWEKELIKHPAFMTGLPKDGNEYSEALEAMQAMKYDSDDPPEEVARVHQRDGNRNFQLKKYRWAVDSYTEGIKANCSDRELNAILHANRAAAQLRLGNVRSALKDCFIAIKFNPLHDKAILRGAECLMQLKLYEQLIQWCDSAAQLSIYERTINEDQEQQLQAKLASMKVEAEKLKKLKDRNIRKEQKQLNRQKDLEERLLTTLKERKIQFWEENMKLNDGLFDISLLEADFGSVVGSCRVQLTDDRRLIWPVVFLYPEFQLSDVIKEFHEDTSFAEQLNEMLDSSRPDWDTEGHYVSKHVTVCFEPYTETDTLCSIPHSLTLKEALSNSKYRIKGGSPSFVVLSTQSDFYATYMSRFHVVSL